MRTRQASIIGLGALASFVGTAIAQPPPTPAPPAPAPQQPVPPTQPPPEAPPPNWAPPLPQEAPPEQPAQPTPLPEAATPPIERAGQPAQPPEEEDNTQLEIYGFAMLDAIYDFGKIGDPNWQDALRPTKLPSFDDEFGKGSRTFGGVRQSRFGVKATLPTDAGDIKTTFEFDMYGVSNDEGQTTIRLRHAYGDWKQLRAGQTHSPFMDIDVFPNSIDYWGPNGMVFFRNVQLAWMPIQGDSRVTVALERPGASPDLGLYADRLELANVAARFPAPDLSAEARYGGDWGYVEGAGIVRYIKWDDLDGMAPDLDGDAWGWGLSLSSNLKLGPTVIRLQGVYGRAIQNYMNDAGADIAPEMTNDPAEPLNGKALAMLGLVGFVDVEWNERFTSTGGYSLVWIDNSNLQAPSAFHMGHYALANLLFHPTEKLFFGPELQFIRRENNSDGFEANDYRIQFSVKYSFSKTLGGK